MKTINITATPVIKNLSIEIPRDEFALLFKTWRIEKGLTQEQAAQMFNVSRFTIIRIENKKPVSWETSYKVYAQLASELLRNEAHQPDRSNNNI